MGLKPDHWIRKMATKHGMIEPFVETQKRDGVISYGVSSYGYDMRVSDEFKVFTNVFSAIVDPKNFSPESFVDIKSDICIIPPNSFALARSVEYFRIPRSVLTVCVGKSTYARCFRGDTKVALVDGTSVSLEDMAKRSEEGEIFFGYSIGQYGRVMVTLLEAPRYIGRDSLIEITLDNGEIINTTPDHEFIMRDGRIKQANELREDDSLMPLYRHLARGYEMIYQPSNGHLYPTHRLADEWNLRHGIYEDRVSTHRHHKDFNRQNNNPWNIERMSADEHIRLHNEINYGEDFDPDEHSQAIKDPFERLKENPEWLANYAEAQSIRAIDFWTLDKYQDIREKLIQYRRESWTDEKRNDVKIRMERYYSNPENIIKKSLSAQEIWKNATDERRKQQREIAQQINLCEEITEEKVRWALNQTGSIRGAARLLDCDRSTFRRFPEILASFRGARTKYRNHKVKSIRHLAGDHDVYCLTVPEAGNFALEAGIFVSNCGLIINVTPFEPEWEGYVTLEISNTTPLPAKVYANEGIAQVLFFEGDDVCEISYADKKGKYQGQTGVTLPKLG